MKKFTLLTQSQQLLFLLDQDMTAEKTDVNSRLSTLIQLLFSFDEDTTTEKGLKL